MVKNLVCNFVVKEIQKKIKYMRWSKNKSRRFSGFDILAARDIVCEVFYEGHLK